MKKIKALALLLALIWVTGITAEAKTAKSAISPTASYASQTQFQFGRNQRRHHPVRVVTRTRIVRYGRRVFRETYQIRYLPNGRTHVTVINRVRIR